MFKSFPKNIILASKSPRRQSLLSELGLKFEVNTKEVEEIYPNHLKRQQVALYLSELKAKAFKDEMNADDLIITSDTIVCLGNDILGKPKDEQEAFDMLSKLSGKSHEVITAVTLMCLNKTTSFYDETEVCFKQLTEDEINYYIDNYKPFDKAGAYGIQEWIGYIGIEKIKGSYFNVVGLPVQKLYQELKNYQL